MKGPLPRVIYLCVFLLNSKMIIAQDSIQKQIWPEVETYYRINERFRIYSALSGTKSSSEYTDGIAGIYLDYFTLPWLKGRRDHTQLSDNSKGYFWWFRLGYSYSNSLPGDAKKVVNILETETNNSYFIPADIVLQTRNRMDWRWVNGDFQPIYRPRIKFVRNLKTEYLTFNAYIWSEYFFYLNDNTKDRLRIALGVEIKVLKWLDFETYFLHQFQNKQYVAPLNAIGLQFDLYFKSKNYN